MDTNSAVAHVQPGAFYSTADNSPSSAVGSHSPSAPGSSNDSINGSSAANKIPAVSCGASGSPGAGSHNNLSSICPVAASAFNIMPHSSGTSDGRSSSGQPGEQVSPRFRCGGEITSCD